MKSRLAFLIAVVGLFATAAAVPAKAQDYTSGTCSTCNGAVAVAPGGCGSHDGSYISAFFRSIARDTKRRNCWPQPFTAADTQTVRAPACQMIANGWQRQNTLGDHHFQPEDGQLTQAGRLKVRWILTQAPQQHREIYVARPLSVAPEQVANTTAARIDSVQQFAARVVPQGDLPPIMETDTPAPGWPGSRNVDIEQSWRPWPWPTGKGADLVKPLWEEGLSSGSSSQ